VPSGIFFQVGNELIRDWWLAWFGIADWCVIGCECLVIGSQAKKKLGASFFIAGDPGV
jgi:hypothetical protein